MQGLYGVVRICHNQTWLACNSTLKQGTMIDLNNKNL
jgi:hypothetical protein